MIAVPVIGAGSALASPAADPGSTLWTTMHDDSLGDAMATSPDGSQVFIAGGSDSKGLVTVAYDAATGQQQWDSALVTPGSGDQAIAVAVSPDGSTVFATGGAGGSYVTIAYSAATGQQLWVSRYSGDASPAALALSPDGTTVYVTGTSKTKKTSWDYATVAYQAATGRQLWASRYNGRAGKGDFAHALAVSPDGSTVYVTGGSQGRTSGLDAATIAYQASTGRQLWVSRYNGRANGADAGASVAVSLDGTRVFITGTSEGKTSHQDIFTAAYAAAHGTPLWTRRYNGPANLDDEGQKVIVSPDGGTVIACGTTRARTYNYVAIAYSPVTGAALWTGDYNGTGNRNTLSSAAISQDGSTLYLVGTAVQLFDGGGINSYGFTAAVNPATGAQLWGQITTVQDGINSYGGPIAVSPDGSAVYSVINSFGPDEGFQTTAFQG